MFKDIPQPFHPPALEKELQGIWDKERLFEKVNDSRSDSPNFVFYEGPPTANGHPGIHHVMARAAKDAVCRYKTMRGFSVPRKAGWDTHGLPVEREVEKQKKLEGKPDIEKYGVEKFNRECRESVFTYKDRWDAMTRQMAYWIDLSDPYITLDNNYIESVWWALKSFHDAGLIYKGYRVVPYCPRCGTPLSSHEVALGYKMVKDPSATVVMRGKGVDFDLLVWTTTPWTLFSNVAVAVGREIDYVKVKLPSRERPAILAKARMSILEDGAEIVAEMKGKELVGTEYEALLPDCKPDEPAYKVLSADFVSTEDGTGLVHLAPAFGDDDFKTCREHGFPMVNPVDETGCFTSAVPDFAGRFVKEADPDIIGRLKHEGKLYKSQKIEHSYPHCWRCTTPLIYYARDAWYIRATDLKQKLIEANSTVSWHPESIGEGRFGKWLENLQDWSLSRDRYWGTPLNIWTCGKEDCDGEISVGSREELHQLTGADLDIELHKPYVDEIAIPCPKCGKAMKRTPEVIDCWFDSGSMPFAQHHYPFENRDLFDEQYPADYICEGVDQTRGWFYSLLAINTFLFGKAPYRNVLVNELVLDKDGMKMSKSRGNGVDPFEMLDTHGADILRWYLLTSTSVWLPIRFDVEALGGVRRKLFDTLVNTYRFFVMYANLDEFGPETERIAPEMRPEFDRWLLSRMNSVAGEVLREMDNYDLTKAMNALSHFVTEDLSNWYVRLNRRRFWKEGDSGDKTAAYCTLQEVLIAVSRLMAPVAPYLSDYIHRELSGEGSVHLALMPEPDAGLSDLELEQRMDNTRTVVELGRNLRTRHGLKVRQPLSEILVQAKGSYFQGYVLSELNVKKCTLADEGAELVKRRAKANFRKLGPIFGKKVPLVAKAITQLDSESVSRVEFGEDAFVELEGETVKVPAEAIEVLYDEIEGMVAEGNGRIMVALKTELSDELIQEGKAREIVNRLQNLRKDMGLDVSDRIRLKISGDAELVEASAKHADYLRYELLADFDPEVMPEDDKASEVQVDGQSLRAEITRL